MIKDTNKRITITIPVYILELFKKTDLGSLTLSQSIFKLMFDYIREYQMLQRGLTTK